MLILPSDADVDVFMLKSVASVCSVLARLILSKSAGESWVISLALLAFLSSSVLRLSGICDSLSTDFDVLFCPGSPENEQVKKKNPSMSSR